MALVSVRRVLESYESSVIQGGGLIRGGVTDVDEQEPRPLPNPLAEANLRRDRGRAETGMFLELIQSNPRAHKVATEAARDWTEPRPIHGRGEWKALADPRSHGNAPSNPWVGAIADTANLAPVSSEY